MMGKAFIGRTGFPRRRVWRVVALAAAVFAIGAASAGEAPQGDPQVERLLKFARGCKDKQFLDYATKATDRILQIPGLAPEFEIETVLLRGDLFRQMALLAKKDEDAVRYRGLADQAATALQTKFPGHSSLRKLKFTQMLANANLAFQSLQMKGEAARPDVEKTLREALVRGEEFLKSTQTAVDEVKKKYGIPDKDVVDFDTLRGEWPKEWSPDKNGEIKNALMAGLTAKCEVHYLLNNLRYLAATQVWGDGSKEQKDLLTKAKDGFADYGSDCLASPESDLWMGKCDLALKEYESAKWSFDTVVEIVSGLNPTGISPDDRKRLESMAQEACTKRAEVAFRLGEKTEEAEKAEKFKECIAGVEDMMKKFPAMKDNDAAIEARIFKVRAHWALSGLLNRELNKVEARKEQATAQRLAEELARLNKPKYQKMINAILIEIMGGSGVKMGAKFLLELADADSQQGNWKGCMENARQALRLPSQDRTSEGARAWLLLAKSHYAQEQLEEAYIAGRQALKEYGTPKEGPDIIEVMISAAQAMNERAESAFARDLELKALELLRTKYPNDPKAKMAVYYEANILVREALKQIKDEPAKAADKFEKAVERYLSLDKGLEQYELALFRAADITGRIPGLRKGTPEEAAKLRDKAKGIFEQYLKWVEDHKEPSVNNREARKQMVPRAWSSLAGIYVQDKKYDEALAALAKAGPVEGEQEERFLTVRARAFLGLKKYKEAEEAITAIQTKFPQAKNMAGLLVPFGWGVLVDEVDRIKKEGGDARPVQEKALAALEKGYELDPKKFTAELARLIAYTYSGLGNGVKFQAWMEVFKTLGGKVGDEEVEAMFLSQAQDLLARGKFEEALAKAQELETTRDQKKKKQTIETRLIIAKCFEALKKCDEALGTYHDIWEKVPAEKKEQYRLKKFDVKFACGDFEWVLQQMSLLEQLGEIAAMPPEFKTKYEELKKKAEEAASKKGWEKK
ncbi:MAG: hypothetical protein V1809_04135 [Planctomycetota bacterium]